MDIKTKFSIGDTIYAISTDRAGELSGAVCGKIHEINIWEEPGHPEKKHVWYELYGTSMYSPIRRFNGTSWENCMEVYSKVMCDEESSFATEKEVLAEKERRDSALKERQLLYAIQRLENKIKELEKKKDKLSIDIRLEEKYIDSSRRMIKRSEKELKELESELKENELKLAELKNEKEKRDG